MSDGKDELMKCSECDRWMPIECIYLMPKYGGGRYLEARCVDCVADSQIGGNWAIDALNLKTVRELMNAAKGQDDG